MRLLKKAVIAVASLLLIMVLASFLLPQQQHVERSIDVSAPASKIFPYLINPKLFNEWSPWAGIDPNMKTEYSGPKAGKGASMSWQSSNQSVGSGRWTVSNFVDNKSVNIALDFGDQGTGTSTFLLKPNGDKTTITWGFDTDVGMNPVMRWMGLLMDKLVGPAYEEGLSKLKEKVES